MSDKGRVWPGEITAERDERTGSPVWQITRHPSISHNLYFLTSSFLPDEKSLIFAGFRGGSANFYQAGFPRGDIRLLTDSGDINSFSAVISSDGRRLWFTRASAIVVLDLADLSERVLADFGVGKLGEVSLSSDGRWVVTAIRFDDGYGIAVAGTDGSGGCIIHQPRQAIIHRQKRVVIHPQFHPADASLIEYASDPAPRMHLIRRDGSDVRCLYQHGNDEFVVHETWLGDTGDLVFTIWPKAIKRMILPSGEITTIAEFNAWHISPSRDGRWILCDTHCPDVGLQLVEVATGRRRTVCYPGSSNRGSQWPKGRYALEAARAGQSTIDEARSWTEMKTDTVYGPQWTHPHPAFSPTGRYATFTSDRTGQPQVYVVEIERHL